MRAMLRQSFKQDPDITKQKLNPGIVRRIVSYLRPFRLYLGIFLGATCLDAVITVVNPLLLREIIDKGIQGHHERVIIVISAAVAGVAVFEAFLTLAIRWFSAQVGQGIVHSLRTEVFTHVQRQPLAFFTRAQTGSLVSRLNSDINGTQQAITSTLAGLASNVITLLVVLAAMFYLSWQISLIALALIPMFILPVRLVGRRLSRLTRESMQLNATMGSMMTERCNVAGAMLVKLFGRPKEETESFSRLSGKVRGIGVLTSMYGQVLNVSLTLVAALATAAAFGIGGILTLDGHLQLGSLVALTTLVTKLSGPITSLTNIQVNVMTALVSFDRVFEVLDLRPLIEEKPGSVALHSSNGDSAPDIVFDAVSFRYPTAAEVSLASLESIARREPERPGSITGVLHEVSFRVAPGTLTALVGPSGAGKTTVSHLVARFYDPSSGTVRVGGRDLRDATLESLHDTIGVITQDAHLFHDTLRANLLYARPDATEAELVEACEGAQIWEFVSGLPDKLDTVVGDRGYRLSGGEKQRVALARLLLKAPTVVVLDEATAHLDSESEAAVQRALKVALAGRTSLVIAHRLSTIREAQQILVINSGRIAERGGHEELLLAGGLYAELYRTQFAGQKARSV